MNHVSQTLHSRGKIGMRIDHDALSLWLTAEADLKAAYAIDFCYGIETVDRLRGRLETLLWSLEVFREALGQVVTSQMLVLQQHLKPDIDVRNGRSVLSDPEQDLNILPPQLLLTSRGSAFYAYKGFLEEVSDLTRDSMVAPALGGADGVDALLVRVRDRDERGADFPAGADLIFGPSGLRSAFMETCVGRHERQPFAFGQQG